MLTYDGFVPGRSFGVDRHTIAPETLALWMDLFVTDRVVGDTAPAGCAMVLVMQAYMHLLKPRPPGNIHRSQTLSITALPRIGELVSTELICVDKEMKRERRCIHFVSRSKGQDRRELFSGRMIVIWAR